MVTALLPLIVFAALMVVLFGRQEQASLERGLRDTTRALALAVDRELATTIKSLEAIAASPLFDEGDLGGLYDYLQRVRPTQPWWRVTFVTLPDGVPLFGSNRPGSRPPGVSIGDRAYFQQAITTRRPAFSDYMVGRSASPGTMSVVVPVMRAGTVRYVVGASLDLTALSAFLAEQGLPPEWTGSILDRQGVSLARTGDAARHVGELPGPLMRQALGREGWIRGEDQDGRKTYLAYSRSAFADWVVAIAVPASMVDGPPSRSLAAVIAVGVALGAVGVGLALLLGRGVASPIVALARAAEAVGRGEPPPPIPASPVREVEHAEDALVRAARLLADRDRARDRVEADLRRIGEALGIERARLEAVLEQMPAGVILADAPHGGMRFANRQVEAIWRRPWIPSGSIEQYGDWPAFHADGRPYSAEEWPLARALTTGEVVAGEEIRIVRGDGTPAVIRASAAPIRDAQGRIVAGVATMDDVTDEHEAEEMQRFLAEASSRLAVSLDLDATLGTVAALATPRFADGCVVDLLDDDGVFRCVAAADVHPEKAALVREMRRRFPPTHDGAHPLAEAVRTGRPLLLPEMDDHALAAAQGAEHLETLRTLATRSGLVAPLVVRARVLGTICFVRTAASGRRFGPADVPVAEALAERAAVAIDNARLYDDAQEAIRVREAFLARASHELRTPLTSALATVRLLPKALDGSFGQSPAALVDIARRNLDAMLALVNRLLDASKLAAEAGLPPTEPVDLAALVDRTLDLLRPQARDGGVALSARVPPGLAVRADPLGLEQVLVNLLANAVKFTPEGGRVTVEAEGRPGEIVIRVRDTGEGVPSEHLEQIFEPFFQASRRTAPRARGTGLGLAIARQIVARHGGRVWAESDGPGRGSTFIVRLPHAPTAGRAA